MPFCAPKSSPAQMRIHAQAHQLCPDGGGEILALVHQRLNPLGALGHVHQQLLQADKLLHHIEHRQLHVADDEVVMFVFFDVERRVVVAPLGQRVGEGERRDLRGGLDVRQRVDDHVHVDRPLAHLHAELVDEPAVLVHRVRIAPRQARADDHAIAAHRHAQVVVRQAVGDVLVVGGGVVGRDAVLLGEAVGQRAGEIELERDPVGQAGAGESGHGHVVWSSCRLAGRNTQAIGRSAVAPSVLGRSVAASLMRIGTGR